MNKYQETINRLRGYQYSSPFSEDSVQPSLDDIRIADSPANKEHNKHLDILQELVDKESPKKVERDLEGYDAMPTLTTECPNCKEMIWKCIDDERFKYCYCCGQALDWGKQ